MAITHEQGVELATYSDKLTLLPLAALVVGTMIGGGVFKLPSDTSRFERPGTILIGWTITGFGMLMLVFVYHSPVKRKPDLNANPYANGRAGFGSFMGVVSARGYWPSAVLGSVADAVAVFSGIESWVAGGDEEQDGSCPHDRGHARCAGRQD